MALNTFPCNPYPISTEELNKGNNDDMNTRVTTLEGDVSDLNSNKANQITIAPFFNAEASYSVGDLVYYNSLTYRCTNDHEGEWDADDFAATTIAGELDSLKSGLNNVPKFATVNITIPSTVSAVSDLVPLPSGFTKSNTVVVSAYCDPNTATRYYNDVMTVEGVQIFLTNNNVQVSTNASAISEWLGKTITVLLASI